MSFDVGTLFPVRERRSGCTKRGPMPKSKNSSKASISGSENDEVESEPPVVETAEERRRRAHVDDPDVTELRKANGIKKEAFIQRAHLPQKMEIFQLRLQRGLRDVKYFTGLTELVVIGQRGVTSMRGIEVCPNLVTLWVNECSLKTIDDSVVHLTRLRSMHLCTNKIKHINHLERLTALEILWLNDNRIVSLEGLGTLTQLRVLWVANNKLSTIGTTLDNNARLAELNISGNNIGAFKEILNLTRSLSLRSLCLSDPHFGDNPACLLCNYQTYVLYHLSQLSSLDTMLISNESKQLAEATYMKKKMYYNMRIKTLKRNTNNVIRKAQEAMQSKITLINLNLNVLLRQRKGVEGALDELKFFPNGKWAESTSAKEEGAGIPGTPSEESTIRKVMLNRKLRALDDAIDSKGLIIARMESLFEQLKRHLCDVSEENIARLIVELETGGNIRLEDGKPSDVWFSSCADLLKSRFFARDFRAYGVEDIRVNRVTRIHNRFLRNRFDEAMESLVRKHHLPTTGGKRQLEYLFFGDEPKLRVAGNELLRVADAGLRSAREFRKLGLDEAVRLSNSVSLCHLPQIRAFLSDCARNIKFEQEQGGSNSTVPVSCTKQDDTKVGEKSDVGDDINWMDTVAVAGSGVAAALAAKRRRLAGLDQEADVVDSQSLRAAAAALNRGEFLLPPGQLLVVKVFLGNVSGEHGGAASEGDSKGGNGSKGGSKESSGDDTSADGTDDSSSGSDQDESCSDSDASTSVDSSNSHEISKTIRPSAYPDAHAVYRTNATDSKQREWFVFDNALVLPEYLIEFDLVTQSHRLKGVQPSEPKDGEDLKGDGGLKAQLDVAAELLGRSLTEQECLDMGPLLRPLERFMHQCGKILNGTCDSEATNDVSPVKALPALRDSSSAAQNTTNVSPPPPVSRAAKSPRGRSASSADAVLNMPPHLPPPEKLYEISDTILLRRARTDDLTGVVYLNLHGCHIRRIDGLASCVNLQHLILSFNEIHKLEGLDTLTKLERLELGFNLIKRVEGLRGLEALKKLELNNNLIYRLDDVSVMKKYLPGLKFLDLRNNAMCEVKGYRPHVLRRMTTLEWFDGAVIDEDARSLCAQSLSTISKADIIKSGKGSMDANVDISDVSKIDPSIWASMEQLDLNHRGLQSIENLEQLKNLRRLSLADNELATIQGLDENTLLEELVLDENRIQKFEGLSKLAFLKKLDLGKNKLGKFENLSQLVHLTQLSVEDNEIVSLNGLQELKNLMELYVCSNRISTLKEVQHLKTLPKLIIVDLSGNALCRQKNYRLYCVYYLRKLKVLDGIGVDLNEQQNAREKYSGKLTAEFLSEKIGHKYFEHIRELDLSSCRIREIEHLSGEEFSNLRELNLDNNMLTDVNGLHALWKLQILRMNHNRINSLSVPSPSLANAGPEVSTPAQYGLGALTCLEVLQLGYNSITDCCNLNLHKLPGLKVLFLQGNDIARVDGLNECCELRELVLDKNRIKYVDTNAFLGLSNLRELRLEENGLRSLSNFRNIHNLQLLYLGMNRVSEMAELDKLSTIPFLMELTLANNPVSRKQLYRANVIRRMPTLKIVDGREVGIEERERVELMFVQDSRFNQPPQQVFFADQGHGYDQLGVQTAQSKNTTTMQGLVGSRGGGSGNRAVKLTSVNFDSLTGLAQRRQQTSLQHHQSVADQGHMLPAAQSGGNQFQPQNFLTTEGGGRRQTADSITSYSLVGRRSSGVGAVLSTGSGFKANPSLSSQRSHRRAYPPRG